MTTQELRYLSYLLRLWQVRDNEKMIWRASLEDAHTGERRGFANLDDLFEFLVTETRAPRQSDEKSKDKQMPNTGLQGEG